jgi:hypothetical protein
MNIPQFLQPFFWEYGDGAVDTAQHTHLIMERVMLRGSWKSMEWLRSTFTTAQIKEFLLTRGVNVLPPRELNYWLLIIDAAPEERTRLVTIARNKNNLWRKRAH